jgi:hypothetical protein
MAVTLRLTIGLPLLPSRYQFRCTSNGIVTSQSALISHFLTVRNCLASQSAGAILLLLGHAIWQLTAPRK